MIYQIFATAEHSRKIHIREIAKEKYADEDVRKLKVGRSGCKEFDIASIQKQKKITDSKKLKLAIKN